MIWFPGNYISRAKTQFPPFFLPVGRREWIKKPLTLTVEHFFFILLILLLLLLNILDSLGVAVDNGIWPLLVAVEHVVGGGGCGSADLCHDDGRCRGCRAASPAAAAAAATAVIHYTISVAAATVYSSSTMKPMVLLSMTHVLISLH